MFFFHNFPASFFHFPLQEELHDYYRLLAVLEQELQRTTPGKTTSSSLKPSDLLQFRQRRAAETTGARDTEEESARKGGVGGSRSAAVDLLGNTNEPTGLTLLRLKAWLQEPIER